MEVMSERSAEHNARPQTAALAVRQLGAERRSRPVNGLILQLHLVPTSSTDDIRMTSHAPTLSCRQAFVFYPFHFLQLNFIFLLLRVKVKYLLDQNKPVRHTHTLKD